MKKSKADREALKSEYSQYVANAEKEIAQGAEIQAALVKRFEESKLEYDRVLGEWKEKFQKATEIARASDENARVASTKIAENEELFRQESIRYQTVIAEKDQALLELNRDLESETQRRIEMAAELDRKKADFESRFLQVSQIEQQHADVIVSKERLIEDLRRNHKKLKTCDLNIRIKFTQSKAFLSSFSSKSVQWTKKTLGKSFLLSFHAFLSV